MNISIFIDLDRPRKKGFPIVLFIFVSKADRVYTSLKYYSSSEDWDSKKQEPKKSHPQYNLIIGEILDLKIKINKIENSKQKRTARQIQTLLLGNYECIYTFWEERITEEEKKLENKNKPIKTGGNASIYRGNLHVWKLFQKSVSYDEINYDFLTRFKIEKSKTCSAGGINTYIKSIRAVYNEAVKRGIYIPEATVSPFKGIMEKTAPTKDKYLTIEEMKILCKNPLDHQYYRYFMLCFFLGGLDFIDIASIKKSDIRNNRIKFIRNKGNTNEVINNYIFPEAKEILDYFFDENSEYLTPLHKFSYDNYRKSYVVRTKELFKKLGIESHVDSKTPRYSFIHIGSKELYQNRDIIKELVGHAQNDTHSIYEGKFPVKIKDEVHRKIIDAVIFQEKEFHSDAEYKDLA
ncbi:phage integrase SAM-like domain-containing protein [Chryseobacterium sp. YIM B08800]|uniref:phage integrase SAM-like domain-containing protein n=1 Tax=Chryseobacterium sp. YIM B08800 TaxID=2984136 RepID=UPI0022403635|nr:phage integrase SAM-like domain-containing protein [Chryseobacterium sp. YIM B08800]